MRDNNRRVDEEDKDLFRKFEDMRNEMKLNEIKNS